VAHVEEGCKGEEVEQEGVARMRRGGGGGRGTFHGGVQGRERRRL